MVDRKWRVRLSKDSKHDIDKIIAWTTKRFGAAQAIHYRETLIAAVEVLRDGPNPASSRAREEEIGPGIRTLHVARHGKPGRHILMCRRTAPWMIEIVRILHDRMEPCGCLGRFETAYTEDKEPDA